MSKVHNDNPDVLAKKIFFVTLSTLTLYVLGVVLFVL